MSALLRPVRDLFWPASCAACGAPGQLLCPACAVAVAALGGLRSHRPSPRPPGFPPTLTWGTYAGALRHLVVAYKDSDRTDLTPVLATLLSEVVDVALQQVDAALLVPIPSAAGARRRRGREPITDLILGMRLTRPAPTAPVLRVVREVRDQAGLDHRARAANLAGSFGLAPGLQLLVAGRDVVVIDDVVTTGATLTEAARVLSAQGAVRSVRAAVLCATPRRVSVVDPGSGSARSSGIKAAASLAGP